MRPIRSPAGACTAVPGADPRRRGLLRAFAGLAAAGTVGAIGAAEDEREIAIVARRFRYEPAEISVRRGERIVLAFTALDFTHGFSLPDFQLRADLLPGLVTRVRLQPQAEGRFTFLCDNFCGEGHEEMNGVLVVTG